MDDSGTTSPVPFCVGCGWNCFTRLGRVERPGKKIGLMCWRCWRVRGRSLAVTHRYTWTGEDAEGNPVVSDSRDFRVGRGGDGSGRARAIPALLNDGVRETQ